jgi:hypothetical protein
MVFCWLGRQAISRRGWCWSRWHLNGEGGNGREKGIPFGTVLVYYHIYSRLHLMEGEEERSVVGGDLTLHSTASIRFIAVNKFHFVVLIYILQLIYI